MPGIEYIETDLDVNGKAKIRSVANAAGVILTYNLVTKDITHRSPDQLVGDLNLTPNNNSYKTSARNMQGILVTTDLDYSQFSGSAWLFEMKGNMYGGGLPLFAQVQGYVWNDLMVNCTGFTTVEYFTSILATNIGGKLCFYFPQFAYWQGFTMRVLDVTNAGDAANINHIVSITEQTSDPGGTKRVTIPITLLTSTDTVYKGLPDNSWAATNHPVITQRRVIGELAWRKYGSGHTITDVSEGKTPDGVTHSATNAEVAWSEGYPMLVGTNNGQTFGVKVDTARRAEELGNYHAVNYVTVFSEQDIYGLKKWTQRFKNTGTGWGNTATASEYSMLFESSNGADINNQSTFSLGFYSSSGVQAGIYVRSNTNNGTSMAFATTDSFSGGPKIAMTINNAGTVDFSRAWPTVSGQNIFHGGNTIDYDHSMETIISVGYAHWGQRKVLSTYWNSEYGDHVILSPPGLSANTATFKMAQNGNGYINDKKIWTTGDFLIGNYMQAWEAATAIGFTNGNTNLAPYIYSAAGGNYTYLATQGWTLSNFINKAGDTFNGGGKIDAVGNLTPRQTNTGGNATGVFWRNVNGVDALIAGIGAMTQSGNLSYTYMGWGASPWDTTSNFAVSETMFAYKGNNVWHAGNLNPVRIGGPGTFNNPIYLGWDNNNIRVTIDNSYIGNLWHSGNFNPNNYHRIDYSLAINNGSAGRHNTTWFDYNWAGTGSPGSVISFGGLNSEYTGELFMQYNSAVMRVGVRSHNGDFNQWNATRFLWHDGHFTQADINAWNSGIANAIIKNLNFATASNNYVAITDNQFGDEAGLWDLQYDYAIMVKWGDEYILGGSLGSYEGVSWNLNNKNVGIGMQATSAAKVSVGGAVKASGNFKSTTESNAETFITNGTTAKLDKEIKNVSHPNGGTGLRVEPAEYFIDTSSFITVDDDNRFLHIIGERQKQVVNLKNIYPRQRIRIYNFDPSGQNLEVRINNQYLMEIPAFRYQSYWVTQDQRLIREGGQEECEFIY